MYRTVLALTAIGLVAAATGCSMCARPFDYCGPTFTGNNCQACNPNARAGSILSPPLESVTEGEVISSEEMVPSTGQETVTSEYYSQETAARPATSNRVAVARRTTRR